MVNNLSIIISKNMLPCHMPGHHMQGHHMPGQHMPEQHEGGSLSRPRARSPWGQTSGAGSGPSGTPWDPGDLQGSLGSHGQGAQVLGTQGRAPGDFGNVGSGAPAPTPHLFVEIHVLKGVDEFLVFNVLIACLKFLTAFRFL